MEGCVNELVSIITPTYNSAKWVLEAINSVKSQSYKNWELLISDDGSTDQTVELVQTEIRNDARIHLITSEVNRGAAIARNRALAMATGRFIAYLDSDDIWMPEKLEHQIEYMISHQYAMCYTSYDIIGENGERRKTIHVPKSVTYEEYLKRPITCTLSIIFDSNVVDKSLLIMPDIRRGQDAATWLQVLKSGITGFALDESLAKYRRHSGSLSSNKFKAVRRTWYLYRQVEKLPLLYSAKCFVSYAFNAVKKYV